MKPVLFNEKFDFIISVNEHFIITVYKMFLDSDFDKGANPQTPSSSPKVSLYFIFLSSLLGCWGDRGAPPDMGG